MTDRIDQKAPLVRSPSCHSVVYGVHGAAGTTGWKALFTRRDLQSQTEAAEWAHLPAGAVSGEHRHTRTEEIYLILEGVGEYFLNGKSCPAGPGFLALMTPGNTHGLRNVGDGVLNWWVIETITPQTQAVLAGLDDIPRSDSEMPTIADLNTTSRVDTSPTFNGPLKCVERHTPSQGDELTFSTSKEEIACFLNKGAGQLSFGETAIEVTAPCSFLIPMGAKAQFEPATDSEVFAVHLKVGVQ
jgi:mannose-6-phosphate isomerase-like protein (cupin superfamily)